MAESAKSGVKLTVFQMDISGHNPSKIALNWLNFKPEGEL